MPDKRKHRGAHPQDRELFADQHHAALRRAVGDFSWLLSQGYAEESSLKLVGDRHGLQARQRLGVWRCSCADDAVRQRRSHQVDLQRCADREIAIDGYNLLITVESALSGGVILKGRDGCERDLASVHGTYRQVSETRSALVLIMDLLKASGMPQVNWYLDRPVSNSGRLKVFMAELLEERGEQWNIQLLDNPDALLVEDDLAVVSTDSWVLDRCAAWINLAGELLDHEFPVLGESIWALPHLRGE